MVILLRISNNSTTCWTELRAFHGQQNYLITNVDTTTKDAARVSDAAFVSNDLRWILFCLFAFSLCRLFLIWQIVNELLLCLVCFIFLIITMVLDKFITMFIFVVSRQFMLLLCRVIYGKCLLDISRELL